MWFLATALPHPDVLWRALSWERSPRTLFTRGVIFPLSVTSEELIYLLSYFCKDVILGSLRKKNRKINQLKPPSLNTVKPHEFGFPVRK